MSLLNWLRTGKSLVNTDKKTKKDKLGIIAASIEVQNARYDIERKKFAKRGAACRFRIAESNMRRYTNSYFDPDFDLLKHHDDGEISEEP